MGKVVWISVGAGLFILGAVLLTAGLVVDLSVFPNIVHSSMKSQKVLGLNKDGTLNDFTKEWAVPNYISSMNYWTFDYKNTIGIMNRAIYPDVIEKGPYAYKETIINDNIDFSEDGEKMYYSQATRYNFDKANSCPTCDPYKDEVTVPDISFIMAMNAVEDMVNQLRHDQFINNTCFKLGNADICHGIESKLVKVLAIIEKEIGTLMEVFGISPFVTVTVDKLIYSGYTAPFLTEFVDKVIDILNTLLDPTNPYFQKPDEDPFKVALNAENGTTDFLYTVYTGKSDYQKSGYTISFTNITETGTASDGHSLPSEWWPSADKCFGGAHALVIDGTNADYFKSFIQKDESLPIYVEDLCRTVNLIYEKEVTVKDIKGYRFVLPSSEFDYSLDKNCGFCNPLEYGAYESPIGSKCFPSGLLDIKNCQAGSPIMISKPHFYQADKLVTSFVPRFKPNYANDETTLDIEPITGTVLSANKKLQINVFMNQFPNISAYSVMRPGAYPLVWLNESFLMDDGTKNQLKSQLFTPQKIIEIICWTAVGVGGALMLIGAIILFFQLCNVSNLFGSKQKDN